MSDFTELVDLASERLGGVAISANDEFFAPKEALVKDAAPTFVEGLYTDRGKWMDGWETRRRRTPGYDWCIVQLGLAGAIHGVVVDTSYFTGNFPEACSIDATALEERVAPDALSGSGVEWIVLLHRKPLLGGTQNRFALDTPGRFTHVRLNIFPDGGVARLRVHGTVLPDWAALGRRDVDLAALDHGGLVLQASDMFFGPRHNLVRPDPPRGMADGWETRRRRGPGHDWVVVRLGTRGLLRRIEIDTTHFKGNAPGSCSLDAVDLKEGSSLELLGDSDWRSLLLPTPVAPDTRNQVELPETMAATHVRLNIFPDGGVARLRVLGEPQQSHG